MKILLEWLEQNPLLVWVAVPAALWLIALALTASQADMKRLREAKADRRRFRKAAPRP